jgi:hypothetical protein
VIIFICIFNILPPAELIVTPWGYYVGVQLLRQGMVTKVLVYSLVESRILVSQTSLPGTVCIEFLLEIYIILCFCNFFYSVVIGLFSFSIVLILCYLELNRRSSGLEANTRTKLECQ